MAKKQMQSLQAKKAPQPAGNLDSPTERLMTVPIQCPIQRKLLPYNEWSQTSEEHKTVGWFRKYWKKLKDDAGETVLILEDNEERTQEAQTFETKVDELSKKVDALLSGRNDSDPMNIDMEALSQMTEIVGMINTEGPHKNESVDLENHEKLLSNETYRNMWEQVSKQGPVSFASHHKGWEGDYTNKAFWSSHDRTISMWHHAPKDYRYSFLAFEMTNAFHEPRFQELRERAMSGEFLKNANNDEEKAATLYAREGEKIEYDGTLLHQEMMKDQPDKLNRYKGKYKDFEAYWDAMENGSVKHANSHRANYRSIMESVLKDK